MISKNKIISLLNFGIYHLSHFGHEIQILERGNQYFFWSKNSPFFYWLEGSIKNTLYKKAQNKSEIAIMACIMLQSSHQEDMGHPPPIAHGISIAHDTNCHLCPGFDKEEPYDEHFIRPFHR